MAKFLYLYSGGQMAETPEAQEEAMQVWTSWFGSLGDSVVDIGNPFSASSAVASGGATVGCGAAMAERGGTLEAAARDRAV